MKFLGIEIFQNIINFFQIIRQGITLEHLLYIFVGLELLTVIIFAFIVHNVYELKLLRAVDKLNAYLYEVKYINESNLIEFNNMMKKVPKTLRYHWQQYMLNRDKNPSYYMSVENCVDRPLKSSYFASNISIIKKLGFIYSILALVFTFGWASGLSALTGEFLITVFAIPLVILLINYFFVLILNIRKTGSINELYQTFHIFNRFIDKAVSTMPNYVDFEVLFTEKEIRRGIPVLNEYIEKRQLLEQEEMKRARENAIQQELYNFEEAGEKGELVLERAMKETELFVNMKNRLNLEIDTFEKEIDSLKRNFDNTSKDYQKKLQASKENSQRLREQQEATTNRIENNYIRKQQADEIKKQQQIEKEFDDAQLRFNQEVNALAEEIKKRKEELELARVNVEKSMLAEYQTFSNKIYAEIRNSVNEKVKGEREELINSRQEIYVELEKALSKVDNLELQNKVLVNNVDKREEFIRAEAFKERTAMKNLLDEKDKIIEEKEKQIALISADFNKKQDKKHDKNKVKKQEIIFEEPVPGKFLGEYDLEGNYRFENGAYFDKVGNFHDENGNVFNKEGILLNKAEDENESQSTITDAAYISEPVFELDDKADQEEILSEEVAENSTEEHDENPADPVEEEFAFDENDIFILNEEYDEFDEEVETDNKDELDEEVETDNKDELDEEVETQQKDEDVPEEQPAKRRGRPRKVETEVAEPTEPKKRGRPRKVETEVQEDKPARKRGRPRKNVDESVESTEPKKRGRPRKVENAVAETTEPKKRGRPRKVETEVVENQPARKRGRPKKEEASLDENLKLIEERLKEQNELLKKQQKALDLTVKKATKK